MKRKILIIENDNDIRNIIAFVLEEEGFETHSVPEPKSLEEVLHFKADVILVDEFINNKPGHRICLQIKQYEQLKNVPVIILSTANDIEVIVTECSANDYVKKPFDIQELINKVIGVIDVKL